MSKIIRSHRQLDVHQLAFELSQGIFLASKGFPREETYSLTDQIRRSSRSITGSLAEGWRKRRYPAAFVSKLYDAEGEAAETQSWIEHSVKCGYLARDEGAKLYRGYDRVLAMLVHMITHADKWTCPAKPTDRIDRSC